MAETYISAIGVTDDAEASGDGTVIGLLKRLRTLLGGSPDPYGAQVVILYPHHEVHEGNTFQSSYKTPDASPIADDGHIALAIQCFDKVAHLTFDAALGGDAEILVYEGATLVSGTALDEYNMNRYLAPANAATAAVSLVTTLNPTGTLISNFFEPGGRGPQAGGGTARQETEWVFNTGTMYVVRALNRAGANQPGSIVLQWYEEDIPT